VIPALLLSDEIKQNANVVVRSSTEEFIILGPEKATQIVHLELSILNSKGKKESSQYVWYDSNKKITNLAATLYDKTGKRVKKYKNSEIEDFSASGSNMYSDSRVKVIDFNFPSYPYTIVLDYKIEHSGIMFYPQWLPQNRNTTAVEKASFKVRVPANLGINYYNKMVEPTIEQENADEIYTWKVENLQAFKSEPYSPPLRERVPYVMLTPKQFAMSGYSGSMSSWQSIGEYDLSLLHNKQNLPDLLKSEVDELIIGKTDKREVAKIIYEYVQNSTRYVSVQLGIGGWEPYDAQYVYENGYGDCKALTNYTMALLRYAGIESIYTSVYAGRGVPDINAEFPNALFNHVILAVPMETDTVWLECTSQTNPFGYLGSFTSDRHVLLSTKEGGKLVKTPRYAEDVSTQIRKIDLSISKEGVAEANVETEYHGLQYENVDHQLRKAPDDQKEWLLKNLNLTGLKINSLSYQHFPEETPSIKESITLSTSGYASVTGNRIFLNPNLFNQHKYIPKKLEARQFEIVVNSAFTDIDSVLISVPENYHIEHMPEPMILKSQFGEYKADFQKTDDGVLYIRKYTRYKGRYPSSTYDELRSMLKEVARFDRSKLVLAGST